MHTVNQGPRNDLDDPSPASLPARRDFLKTGGALAAGVGLGAPAVLRSAERKPVKRQPNIIFAFSDEHRWQSMSFTELPGTNSIHGATGD